MSFRLYFVSFRWAILGLGLLSGLAGAGQAVAGPPAGAVAQRNSRSLRPAPLPLLPGANQQQRIDSMWTLLRAHPRPDTVRVELLTDLADEILVADVRAAGPVIRAACQLARQLGYRDFLAETLLKLADYHIDLAEYRPALPLLAESRREFTRLHDKGGQMRCLGRLARIADQQGRLAEALGYCLRAMAIGSTGDERRFHTSLKIHAASIYTRLGEYAQAHTYLREALAVARHYDYPDRINLIMGELGELSRAQGQWAEARRYYGLSIAVSRRIKVTDQATVRTMKFNLADVTARLGDYVQAQGLGLDVLREAEAGHQTLLVPQVQALLARTALHLGRPDSAIWYAGRSLRASQQARYQEGMQAAYAVLAAAHARRGEWAAAYRAQQQLTAYTDSLTGAEVTRRTATLQLNHERSQNQARLQLLTQQQELDRLRQQRQAAGLLALLLLAALGSGAGLWAYRQRQRRRETALRMTLAADLHDDVGTLLSQISLQSGLLQEGLADAASQRRQLSQISDASRTAVRQLNDVVWSLDAHNDHLPNLLDRMRDYAHEVLSAAGLEVNFDFPEALPAQRLPELLRRNLYLIYKESLHNIIKHAHGATEVKVSLHMKAASPGWLVLQVLDNGRAAPEGPAGAAPAYARRSGHGLRNIAARAQALGGTAANGAEATGFRVQVAVPLMVGRKGYGLGR